MTTTPQIWGPRPQEKGVTGTFAGTKAGNFDSNTMDLVIGTSSVVPKMLPQQQLYILSRYEELSRSCSFIFICFLSEIILGLGETGSLCIQYTTWYTSYDRSGRGTFLRCPVCITTRPKFLFSSSPCTSLFPLAQILMQQLCIPQSLVMIVISRYVLVVPSDDHCCRCQRCHL